MTQVALKKNGAPPGQRDAVRLSFSEVYAGHQNLNPICLFQRIPSQEGVLERCNVVSASPK
jgi:hypothetical protein